MIFSRPLLLGAMALLVAPMPPSFAAQQKPLLGHIDDSRLVTLRGNTRSEANAANDRGPLDDSHPLNNLQLVLHRSPDAEAAAQQYLKELSDPTSPNFHKWLTNAEIGDKFGPARQDIDTVTLWLQTKGFSINGVSPDRMTVEFSGDARLVRSAFHTSIHHLNVNGEAHFANMNDPQIPADLSTVVTGVAKLNDFIPHTMSHPRVAAAKSIMRDGVGNSGSNYLGPADLYTIYGFNAAFNAGITGRGQTIVVVEDTNLFSTGDWNVFRKNFGLSRTYPFGSIVQSNPTGSNTCGNPGLNGDDGEAAIDVEWASAAAPNATIINAGCANTTQFGGFIALANLLQGPTVPNVVSISYGESESELGATENAFISALYQAAGLEGVSIFVSSGDEGAASSDANRTVALHGITVSGYTSTPYNVSVGGTDFAATLMNQVSTYFSPTNGPNFLTAKSYVPEIPWNDSCASQVVSTFLDTFDGFTFTPLSLCNSGNFLTTASGSGGPSNCSSGAPAAPGVANGTCAGTPKPSWQSLIGNPADGVRDIPDVSLMAANGFWGSFYAVCWSDPTFAADGAAPCGSNPAAWAGFGGTSVSSPIWAGIQALVNQSTGQNWGVPNSFIYTLANNEYGAAGNAGCNSTLGNGVSPNCVFYDVTLGDMDVPCRADGNRGTFNCFQNGNTTGLLSTSNTANQPAYGTNTGWDFATGIGTVNVNNFINAWKTQFSPPAQ